jgi:curved DNA-binding protein CbpA
MDEYIVNYYRILGISERASDEQVKRAYRRLVLIYHPDKGWRDDEMFKLITEAYDTLRDPERRREHDNVISDSDVPMNATTDTDQFGLNSCHWSYDRDSDTYSLMKGDQPDWLMLARITRSQLESFDYKQTTLFKLPVVTQRRIKLKKLKHDILIAKSFLYSIHVKGK